MERFGFKRGIFKLIEVDKNGDEVVVDEENTIVNTSFDIITGLMQGDMNKVISHIVLGDGGIINSVKQTPNKNDLNLYSQTFSKEINDIIIERIISPYYITFRFEILEEEGNGDGTTIYNEAGIMTVDGTMFSRKTFFETIKTPEKKLIIEWKFEYSN